VLLLSYSARELRRMVRLRPQAYAAVEGGRYSAGYSPSGRFGSSPSGMIPGKVIVPIRVHAQRDDPGKVVMPIRVLAQRDKPSGHALRVTPACVSIRR
jgi:hypothetical protein